eukprot:995056-Amphidinium_carterae.3
MSLVMVLADHACLQPRRDPPWSITTVQVTAEHLKYDNKSVHPYAALKATAVKDGKAGANFSLD